MNKVWKHIEQESCSECGGDLEVFTEITLAHGQFYDADKVRCIECDLKGQTHVDDEWREDNEPSSWDMPF